MQRLPINFLRASLKKHQMKLSQWIFFSDFTGNNSNISLDIFFRIIIENSFRKTLFDILWYSWISVKNQKKMEFNNSCIQHSLGCFRNCTFRKSSRNLFQKVFHRFLLNVILAHHSRQEMNQPEAANLTNKKTAYLLWIASEISREF